MTIIELKAEAYDTLAHIEHLQRHLAQLNQQIAAEAQKDQTPVPDTTSQKPLDSPQL